MTARILPFDHFRLPPEAPVRRDMTLEAGLRTWLAVHSALIRDPSPSELIDQLVHSTDPVEREALTEALRRTAPCQ